MMTGLTGFLFLGKEKKANGAGGPWLMRIEQLELGARRVGAYLATLGCLGLGWTGLALVFLLPIPPYWNIP
jgi:hypothetical protein